MRCVLIIAAIAAVVSAAGAQQGPNYPAPGSNRGSAFPNSVSPTQTNPLNWHAPQPQYTDPYGPNARWNRRWGWRGWRGGWRR